MASTAKAFVVVTLVMTSLAWEVLAGRNIPSDDAKWLMKHHDRSVLIPGIGRVMIPRIGDNPINYDPITGTPGPPGASIPRIPIIGGSTGGATGRNYVPGGDDTFVPNPGVEVPNPLGGGIPTPSNP